MADTRELILVRIKAVLTTLAGDDIFVWRDRAEFDDTELPAYVLLDGDENKSAGASDRKGPQINLLLPQIFYVPQPTENQLNVGVGEDLSAKRVAMLKAIMLDGELQDLTGVNGYIEYRGMQTDMQTGGEVKGQLRFDFAFAFVFNVTKV